MNSWFRNPSVKTAVLLFIVMRLFLSGWAIAAQAINPLPPEPDETVRPYLGEPILDEGVGALLLGPWQRFDANRYLRIARLGYDDEQNSVFPPLYPLLVRGIGELFGGGSVANLIAAILISNVAAVALFALLHRFVWQETDQPTATRTVVYLALFPAGFFLLAPYTESLFILFSLGAIWRARHGRFWQAGGLGLLASLTRLTGWALVVPLAYEAWRQKTKNEKRKWWRRLPFAEPGVWLPLLGFIGFVGWRWRAGFPSLPVMYEQYWFQTTGLPGADLWTAVQTIFFGGAARAGHFTLYFDFFCAILLIVTTLFTFRKLGATLGLYSAMMLLFILLPASPFKPLFSFSRYTLAFFPTFMLLGMAGKRPWLNRLILYPSIALTLYFTGQFFSWGWVG